MNKALFYIIQLVIITSVFSLHAQSGTGTLSSSETELLNTLSFDKSILTDLRSETGSNAERFYLPGKVKIEKGIQTETEKIYFAGLLFRVKKEKADHVIAKFSKPLAKKGYVIFKSEGNLRDDPYKIGVFKTTDQFEILKIMGTNASHYGHDNAWVIDYAKNIFDKYPFRLTGAEIDWLEAEFITPPKDWTQFAQELYRDCPDIFENEEESINEVAKKMSNTNKIYLLWE